MPPPPNTSPPALAARHASAGDPADLRERILRASIELLTEEGVGGLSLREVARRAGVSHQAPYHHFTDRQAILAAIAEDGFRRLGDAIEIAMVDLEAAPLDALERACTAYVTFACDNPAHFRVMFRPELVAVDRFPECEREGDRAYGSLTKGVHHLVAHGLFEGDEEPLVALIWSLTHGLSSLLLDGPLAMKIPRAADRDRVIADVLRTFRTLLSNQRR